MHIREQKHGATSENVIQGFLRIAQFYLRQKAFDESIVVGSVALEMLKKQTNRLNLELYLESLECVGQAQMLHGGSEKKD